MKKSLVVIVIIIATIFFLYIVWLREGVTSTEWAIKLVGGEKTIGADIAINDDDQLFIKSINPRPTTSQALAILSDRSCHSPSEICLNANLSIANTLAITGQDLPTAKFFVDHYSSVLTEKCPIKAEVSRLVYETSFLIANPDEHAAKKLLDKIKGNGGISHSLSTPDCHDYLASRPYFSKAYLFYLATLMALAKNSPDSASLYLLFISEYDK